MEPVFNIDMHCHPAIKPFGKSFPWNINSSEKNDKSCIWFYNPPGLWNKIRNIVLTVTKFSQSDFTSLSKGDIKVISASLSPIEKGFFTPCFGTGIIADLIFNYVTCIGKKKIDFIQSNNDYFSELVNEYNFYRQLDGKIIEINKIQHQYRLTRTFNDITTNPDNGIKTIFVILSIEGGHVFNRHSNLPPENHEILSNIQAVKDWIHRPLFISLSHHFYNDLGGHAQSLSGITAKVIDQSYGINTGLTDLGKQVIHNLLENTNNKRIYIDVKHMSRKSRIDYYEILDTDLRNEAIPIIVSHGALNGYPSVYDNDCPCNADHGKFYGKDINFFDDEIVKITKSNGLFCLQLDDRRIASKSESKKIRQFYYSRKTKLKLRAGLVWNQIRRVAEILDDHDLFSWGSVAIGTDFDGMVDPPNGYWTSEYLPLLCHHLLEYARNYTQSEIFRLKNDENRSASAEDIIRRVIAINAINFLSKYYK